MKINKKRAALWGVIALEAGLIGGLIGYNLAEEAQAAEPVAETIYFEENIVLPEENAMLTNYQRELIERIVMAEARGESYEGQKAVAEVIYNRCLIWGLSVEDVLLTKYQFADPYQGEISESVRQAVSEVFDAQNIEMTEALYFHADYVNPYWSEEMEFLQQIGGHKFYAER